MSVTDTVVQATVDRLAKALALPILVEDEDHRPICWSVQAGVDGTRLRTILERTVAPEAAAMVARLHLAKATGPVRTPEVPEADMLARWCVPLRDGRHLLGYLWVVDEQGRVGDTDLPLLVAAAREAEVALADERSTSERHLRRRAGLLDRLQGGRDEAAAAALIALEQLDPVTTVVVQAPGVPGGWELPGGMTAHLHQASSRVTGPAEPTSGSPVPLVDLSTAVRRAGQVRATIGAGAVLARPTWDSLGAWHLIVDAPPELRVSDIHPGADVLARLPRPDLLLTARAVLEHTGNIAAAAAELHVHRTTLHYRLERIDALIGVDIRNGASHADLLMAIRLGAYRQSTG